MGAAELAARWSLRQRTPDEFTGDCPLCLADNALRVGTGAHSVTADCTRCNDTAALQRLLSGA